MARDVGWTALEWPGMEHVIVSDDAGCWPRAEGRLILADPAPVSVGYVLSCDPGWRFRTLTISVTTATAERVLTLTSDDGSWLADGRPRPDLDGCLDIDINRSPLTNTLPIRRLDWSAARRYDIDVAYVTVPELEVSKARQRYARLDGGDGGPGQFRYESGSFARDLQVDNGGLVLDYPGLWRRLAPAS
jgi:uncharacterized protein